MLTIRAVPFGTTPETLTLAGTKELTDAYDTYFAGPLGPLVKANAGDFFVDSHASDPWGAPEELWSSDMRTQFQARAGYDIVPDLAGALRSDDARLGPRRPGHRRAVLQLQRRLRQPHPLGLQPRPQRPLHARTACVPFQNWAHTYNMKLRLQQEDGPDHVDRRRGRRRRPSSIAPSSSR